MQGSFFNHYIIFLEQDIFFFILNVQSKHSILYTIDYYFYIECPSKTFIFYIYMFIDLNSFFSLPNILGIDLQAWYPRQPTLLGPRIPCMSFFALKSKLDFSVYPISVLFLYWYNFSSFFSTLYGQTKGHVEVSFQNRSSI